jgi:hypothetical protein
VRAWALGTRIVESIASNDVDINGYASDFLEEGTHLIQIVAPEALVGTPRAARIKAATIPPSRSTARAARRSAARNGLPLRTYPERGLSTNCSRLSTKLGRPES